MLCKHGRRRTRCIKCQGAVEKRKFLKKVAFDMRRFNMITTGSFEIDMEVANVRNN